MKQIYHKKNELFEVEFYEDKECTKALTLDYTQKYYIKDFHLLPYYLGLDWHWRYDVPTVYVPYIPSGYNTKMNVKTLNHITPNLSKYIPEDNAVLFLSLEDCDEYGQDDFEWVLYDYAIKHLNYDFCKKITIFLTHGTQASLQKANEVAKELKEKYGVQEVNLFVLQLFVRKLSAKTKKMDYYFYENKLFQWTEENSTQPTQFNKIITTNSTGILEPQNTKSLQVIDCKEIFEEYLKESN